MYSVTVDINAETLLLCRSTRVYNTDTPYQCARGGDGSGDDDGGGGDGRGGGDGGGGDGGSGGDGGGGGGGSGGVGVGVTSMATLYDREWTCRCIRYLAGHCLTSGWNDRLLTASAWALAQIDPYHSSNCLVPLFIVGKLYVNSMIANLNSRRHFRTVVERTIDYSMHASAFDTSRLATE
ncbi:hypothetical protein FIBSPDRAFT_889259 [Athelia psychrophila]|uniref:DUF6534 domain-containing protein n=1 Tax=Athelia psychrophila TaxID=1759441 RepID=A0A166MIZ4_9AGAM|nr:hypothetical protein FIBSPDRAFT_889259 [Fibularhizoctonia sp. CBS 109695]